MLLWRETRLEGKTGPRLVLKGEARRGKKKKKCIVKVPKLSYGKGWRG